MMHDKRLKKYSINFTVFGNKKIIVKSYQNHNGTIVGFITQSKSIEFAKKKFAVYLSSSQLLQLQKSKKRNKSSFNILFLLFFHQANAITHVIVSIQTPVACSQKFPQVYKMDDDTYICRNKKNLLKCLAPTKIKPSVLLYFFNYLTSK